MTVPALGHAARVASFALLLALGAPSGDRPAGPGRIVAPFGARAAAAAPDPASEFVRFGWMSPPVDSTTAARVAEMGGAGLDLMLPAWADSGRLADNLARLDLAAAHGLRCLIFDRRIERFLTLDPESAAGGALLDSMVADYRDHPAFYGWYLGDEPKPELWPLLAKLFRELRARDPAHPAWNNLLGRAGYATRTQWEAGTIDYLDRVQPAILCNDHYDFGVDGDHGHFLENLEGLRAWASSRSIPFWVILQLVGHGDLRQTTAGELAWQAAMALAYGAHGVGWFTYWTPPPDTVWNWHPAVITWDGQRTDRYDVLAALNPRLEAAGETLADLTWLATTFTGGAPPPTTPFAPDPDLAGVEGRAALGQFVDGGGLRHLLIANRDSAAARTVTLSLARAMPLWKLGTVPGEWIPVTPSSGPGGGRVILDLAPGDFTLLRLGLPFLGLESGRGPGLRAFPNPARGEVRFTLTNLGGGGRLELLDAGGRRVWSHPTGPADATVAWRGETDGRGTAPPGLYFARAETGRGVTVRRVQWLGNR